MTKDTHAEEKLNPPSNSHFMANVEMRVEVWALLCLPLVGVSPCNYRLFLKLVTTVV